MASHAYEEGEYNVPELIASGRISEATVASCSLAPNDEVWVRRMGPCKHPDARVAVTVAEDDFGSAAVLLTPADARRIAAALLNAADEVEGQTPLLLSWPGDAE